MNLLRLERKIFTDVSTIGDLYFDDEFECYTLEDTCRKGEKVAGKTAIPGGRYEVVITYSNRFKKPLPLLLNVPNFTGIRIHPGNTAEDTEGCLLLGMGVEKDAIGNSRAAFDHFLPKLEASLKSGKVFIEILGGG